MENSPLRASGFVFGGLFLGIWLFLALFPTDLFRETNVNPGLWGFWGVVGLAISGGLYATRVAQVGVRIAIWVTLGIAIGMLAGAALFNQVAASVAALFTVGGGGLIVSALPVPTPPTTADEDLEADPVEDDEPAEPIVRVRRRSA